MISEMDSTAQKKRNPAVRMSKGQQAADPKATPLVYNAYVKAPH